MADDIVSTARLEGADQVVSGFEQMGQAGADASKAMAAGVEPLNKQLGTVAKNIANVEAASRKFGGSLRDVGGAAQTFAGNISRVVGTVARYASVVTAMVVVANKLARSQSEQSDETREAIKLNQLAGKSLADMQVRAIQNEKAQSDLNDQLVRGEITSSQYAKALVKLTQEQAKEEQMARRIELIRSSEAEARIKQETAIRRESEARRAYAESVRSFGADTANALLQFGTAWERFNQLMNQGESLVATVFRGIADFLNQNGQEIVSILDTMGNNLAKVFDQGGTSGQSFGDKLMEIFRGVANIVNSVLIPAFKAVLDVFRSIAGIINAVFGTELSGEAVLIATVVLQMVGAFRLLIAIIYPVITALGVMRVALIALGFTPVGAAITVIVVALGLLAAALIAINWQAVASAAATAWESIKSAWNAVPQFFADLWASIKQMASDAWNGLVSAAASAASAIGNAFTAAFPNLTRLINLIKDATKALLEMSAAQSEASGGGGEGFKRGGPIVGRGSSTSDTVPIWASPGEWMMRARAVQHYGRGFMAAVNSLRFPRSPFDQLSDALVVATPKAHFATGGEITRSSGGDGRPVILQFPDGQSFALNAASETADRLGRYAVSRRLSAAGRKPSYYGSP